MPKDLVLAIAEVNLLTIHYTPVYLDIKTGVLDVEGYVPKEAILDTRATKVVMSKNFAAAMAIHAVSLAKGTEFVTASGAVEVSLGVTYSTVEFYLGRGTPHALSVHLHVTVVDTTAYDVLLGTEFMAAHGFSTLPFPITTPHRVRVLQRPSKRGSGLTRRARSRR